MAIPVRTTARLILRPFREEDAEALYRILSVDGILRYFPNPTAPDLARVQAFIARRQRHWEEYGYSYWAMETRSDGELIGWNGLEYLPETDETEVGYLVAKPHWGQGYASEGARESLRFGFEELSIQGVVGIVHPDNFASCRVLEKIGMVFTGEAEYFGMHVRRYWIERSVGVGSVRNVF